MTQSLSAPRSLPVAPRRAPILRALTAVTLALAVLSSAAHGQRRGAQKPEALRGSRASVEKMYEFARRNGFSFYLTPTNVDDAISRGRLVALTGDSTYELTRGVGFSYATREVKEFVRQYAPQYLHACGSPLTVTSAARPKSRQPHNANPLSVHPTGIAVDIRRPSPGPCLEWVRQSLVDLERRGVIEATEERHPVHLHLAVLTPPGGRIALPDLVRDVAAAPRLASTIMQVAAATVAAPPARTNVFSGGDVNLVPATSSGERTPYRLLTAPLAALASPLTVSGARPPSLAAAPSRTAPGPVATRTTPATRRAPVAPAARTYQVRPGDTLWDVASKVGISVKELASANRRSAKATLTPGTILIVPEPIGR